MAKSYATLVPLGYRIAGQFVAFAPRGAVFVEQVRGRKAQVRYASGAKEWISADDLELTTADGLVMVKNQQS